MNHRRRGRLGSTLFGEKDAEIGGSVGESTSPEPAKLTLAGFEDRKGHRTPCASARSSVYKKIRAGQEIGTSDHRDIGSSDHRAIQDLEFLTQRDRRNWDANLRWMKLMR